MGSNPVIPPTGRAEAPAHPAKKAAVSSLHGGADQAQAARRLVQRLAHHGARVMHEHHVPDLRITPRVNAAKCLLFRLRPTAMPLEARRSER